MRYIIFNNALTYSETVWPLTTPTMSLTMPWLMSACNSVAPKDDKVHSLYVLLSREADISLRTGFHIGAAGKTRHDVVFTVDDTPERHDFIAGQWVSRGRHASPNYNAAQYEDLMISEAGKPLAFVRFQRVETFSFNWPDKHKQCADLALIACERVMGAIAGHTDWHPHPEVDQDNWNPDAHIEITLTVADCRAIKKALAAAGKLERFTKDFGKNKL